MARNWILFVVGVIAISTTFFAVMIYKGARDPAIATVPGYYERGLNWDEHQRRLADNAKLGWTATWSVTPLDEGARITLRVTGPDGNPIGDTATARAFHNANPNNVTATDLETVATGHFQTTLVNPIIGHWRARADVTAGDTTFFTETALFLTPTSPPATTPTAE